MEISLSSELTLLLVGSEKISFLLSFRWFPNELRRQLSTIATSAVGA
jgi:hypothetical protein